MTKLASNPSLYLSPREYLLGDSAFENSSSMVSAYKNLPGPGGSQSLEQEKFNTCLGRGQVISEHTIGLLKGRFPWLRHMQRVIKKNPKQSMKQILRLIDSCVILHNLLLAQGDDDIPNNWHNDKDDASDIDSPTNCLPMMMY
jgi:hypothetical protein